MSTTQPFPPGPWVSVDRVRVAPLAKHQLSRVAKVTLAAIRRRTRSTEDFNVFRTFARLGPTFPVHSWLVGDC